MFIVLLLTSSRLDLLSFKYFLTPLIVSLSGFDYVQLNYDIMDIEWEGVLLPGDLLYIPDRAYHQALPDRPRLSISIPCVPTVLNPEFYDRRNYKIQTDN